jgi:hypothetical protein
MEAILPCWQSTTHRSPESAFKSVSYGYPQSTVLGPALELSDIDNNIDIVASMISDDSRFIANVAEDVNNLLTENKLLGLPGSALTVSVYWWAV